MPDRMSPLDAAFLTLEDEDPEVSLAICSVAVLDGPAPAHEEFLAALRARLPLVPRCRQRLRTLPFDLGPPVWVEDPGFDLESHVRRGTLPEPGDDAALSERIAEIMSSRLDRDRPLWEYWVIDGLSGGRWAVLVKVHHCVLDGVSGVGVFSLLFDDSPHGPAEPSPDTWRPGAEPSTLRLAGDAALGLLRGPAEQIRLLGRALRDPRAAARHAAGVGRGLATLARALRPAAASSLTGPAGKRRRYTFTRAPLPEVIETAHRAGTSVNDVLLCAIAGGFRSVLLRRGDDPHPHAVRSLVPVSVRAPGEESLLANRISMMLPYLPVHVADPVERLRLVHEHLTELKESGQAQAGDVITTLARHQPYPPISWAIRAAARLPQRHITTVTSNVPGPRRPLHLLGRRVLEILPYVPIAIGMRFGVTLFTYCDQAVFGYTADHDNAPDVEAFARAVAAELDDLVTAYGPPPPRPPAPPGPRAPVAATTRRRAAREHSPDRTRPTRRSSARSRTG